MSRPSIDFSRLRPSRLAAIGRVLSLCDFPWERLRANPTYPVIERDVSGTQVPGTTGTWGIGTNAAIEIDDSLSDEDFGWVFLAEAAHMVDFFFLTSQHRLAIHDISHGGFTGHFHWWEGSYFERPGEAWMGAFIAAYAPSLNRPDPSFSHYRAGIGNEVRAIVTPDLPPHPVWTPDIPEPPHHAHGHPHPHRRGRNHHHPVALRQRRRHRRRHR